MIAYFDCYSGISGDMILGASSMQGLTRMISSQSFRLEQAGSNTSTSQSAKCCGKASAAHTSRS